MHEALTDRDLGWMPYMPGFFSRREVVRQLGHKPTLYVTRKRDATGWRYWACTPKELSDIEREYAEEAWAQR